MGDRDHSRNDKEEDEEDEEEEEKGEKTQGHIRSSYQPRLLC